MSAEPLEPVGPPCSARAWSVEPNCRCASCLVVRRRVEKLRRSGITMPDLSVQAWAALDRMLAAGRSVSDIAATSGIDRRVLSTQLRQRKARGQKTIRYSRALAIIAAESKPAVAGVVIAVGSRRRLQALAVMGWTQRDIGARCGLEDSVLSVIQSGRVLRTAAAKAAAIAAVYEELQNQRGPSANATVRALNRGWAPPAAWDDPDDLAERPKGATRRERPTGLEGRTR